MESRRLANRIDTVLGTLTAHRNTTVVDDLLSQAADHGMSRGDR
ncbi:hypothetical protein [Actinocatenispora comari]|nr:hypothetical protein [Actinocatenispora comari]